MAFCLKVASGIEGSRDDRGNGVPHLLSATLRINTTLVAVAGFLTATVAGDSAKAERIPGVEHAFPPVTKNEPILISFLPPSINKLEVDSMQTVYFNCSRSNVTVGRVDSNADFLVRITSDKPWIARPVRPAAKLPSGNGADNATSDMSPKSAIYIRIVAVKMDVNFTIHALQAGRVSMEVVFEHADETSAMAVSSSSASHVVGALQPVSDNAFEYPVVVIRKQRMADFVFNSAAAAIGIIISFGIGCATKVDLVKHQLKFPVSLIVAFFSQIIIMPLLAFGLASLLQVDNETRFGFLCVACVPGGGMGHMATVISRNSVPLSLTTNLISVVSMLGTAPLWMFVLGQQFHKVIPIYNFEIWLAATFLAYSLGLLTSRFKQTLAEGLLTWIIKPLLLLTTILYITVGVYINMYVFQDVNGNALLGAILLPCSGFFVGYILALIFRQKPEFQKTIATETSSLNCLIVVAALRFSLDQPDADLASIAPIWVMFTIPGMYISLTILKKFGSCVSGFLENQKQKQYKNFSLASGILNQANMTTLSAPLFIGESINDDSHVNSNEKVTVL